MPMCRKSSECSLRRYDLAVCKSVAILELDARTWIFVYLDGLMARRDSESDAVNHDGKHQYGCPRRVCPTILLATSGHVPGPRYRGCAGYLADTGSGNMGVR